MLRFLIDECLSPELAGVAKERGHGALHVTWVNRAGYSDRSLMPYVLDGEYTLVTNNGADFRALYRSLAVHPGLIVILPSLRKAGQIAVFERFLDHVAERPDLINKLVTLDADGDMTMSDFPLDG